MKFFKRYCFTFILFISINIYAQNSSEAVFNFPVSPETYQFKKNLINDVSLYTGSPQINIPIYTIVVDDVEIPISLSYTPGGIRVDEESSIAGLGWMLNFGGEINRNNHGAVDERGFLTTAYSGPNGIGTLKQEIPGKNYNIDYSSGYHFIYPYPSAASSEYWRRTGEVYYPAIIQSDPYYLSDTPVDLRPDEFHFSVLGFSGKFMFSQELGKFIIFPLEDIKVNYSVTAKRFNNITLSLPNGITAKFGDDGRRTVRRITAASDQAWLIKEISTKNLKKIIYNYTIASYASCTNPQQFIDLPMPGMPIGGIISNLTNTGGSCDEYQNQDALVSSIVFDKGHVDFFYEARIDMMTGSKRLSEVKVFDANNNLIKRIKLNQTYFTGNEGLYPSDNVRSKRLRLDSVDIFGSTNDDPQTYKFEYYLFDKVPTKMSLGYDHWGYYNGKTNTSRIPTYLLGSGVCDRDVDPQYSKTFHLKKIQYPEGGGKVFIMENHRAAINSTMAGMLDEISNANYQILTLGFSVSWIRDVEGGYSPLPSPVNNYEDMFYGEPFDLLASDMSLPGVTNNLYYNSNLPQQVNNIISLSDPNNNKVDFMLQKYVNGSWTTLNYFGTVTGSANATVNTHYNIPSAGTYRFAVKISHYYVTTAPGFQNLSTHSSSINIQIRRRVQGQSQDREIIVGGLRVQEIDTYENFNNPEKYVTQYEYLTDQNTCSGKLTNIPDYSQNMAYRTPQAFDPAETDVTLGYRLTSNCTLPLYKTSGSNVGYTKVTKKEISGGEIIKQDAYYSFIDSQMSDLDSNDNLREYEPRDWQRGKLINTKTYNENGIVTEEIYNYNGTYTYGDNDIDKGYVDEINTDLCDSTEMYMLPGSSKRKLTTCAYMCTNLYGEDNINAIGIVRKIPYFKIYTGFDKPSSKTIKNYLNGNLVEMKEEYFYGNVPQYTTMTAKAVSTSTGEKIKDKLYYPQNLPGEPYMSQLLAANRVAETVKTENYKVDVDGNEIKLSENKTVYTSSPSSVSGVNLYLPFEIYSKKGSGAITVDDRKVTLNKYDKYGNLQQYTREYGIPVSILWGYNSTAPIAKVEGATFSSVLSALSMTETQIQSMQAAPSNIRTILSGAPMVTTYTYIPLVGVDSITDVKGYTTHYEYDIFGRLYRIKDNDNNVIKENTYHFKPQN